MGFRISNYSPRLKLNLYRMKKPWLLLVFPALIACDEDPGPDLTSGRISFDWNTPASISTYYAMISDTTGNVLQWSKLSNGVAMEMPYPPDAKLAIVTIIEDIKYTTSTHLTRIYTYTALPGDSYSHEALIPTGPLPTNGDYIINILERSKYQNVTQFISGEPVFKSNSTSSDTEQTSYGLYDTRTHNLYVSLMKVGTDKTRYLYTADVKPGQTTTIASADFDTFVELPIHAITYPEHQQMTYTFGFLTGVSSNGTHSIYAGQWTPPQTPVLGYPDIPALFPTYSTVMVSVDANDISYSTEVRASQPTTTFTTLNATLVNGISLTTKRVAANLSGDGDIIYANVAFGPSSAGVDWMLFSKAESKVRINLPLFPADLVLELPSLAQANDKSFSFLAIRKINMSYEDFCEFRLKGNFHADPNEVISKTYPESAF
jgi:hypothetical protein